MTTTIHAGAIPVTSVVCPNWCTVSQEMHLGDLHNLEGRAIHWSADVEGKGWSVHFASDTYANGVVDMTDPPSVHVHSPGEGMSPDEALRFAAAVHEAAICGVPAARVRSFVTLKAAGFSLVWTRCCITWRAGRVGGKQSPVSPRFPPQREVGAIRAPRLPLPPAARGSPGSGCTRGPRSGRDLSPVAGGLSAFCVSPVEVMVQTGRSAILLSGSVRSLHPRVGRPESRHVARSTHPKWAPAAKASCGARTQQAPRWESHMFRHAHKSSLTLSEAAKVMHGSQAHVIALLALGHLRAHEDSHGGRLRVDRAELEAYIQRQYEATERELRERQQG